MSHSDLAELISAEHQRLYRDYYAARTTISRPSVWLPRVEALAEQVGAETILDYGCGPARGLSRFSQYEVTDYDPGVAECSVPPSPADLVASIHVLEHVEPRFIDAVMAHMMALSKRALLLVISCEQSTKTLPDGSPWHSFVRDAAWWREKLPQFDPQPVMKDRPGAEYSGLWMAR